SVARGPLTGGAAARRAPPADRTGEEREDNRSGRREIAWRTDGQGLTFLEQEAARPRAAARGGATTAPDDDQPPASGRRGRGADAVPRKDRVYQWLPPFDAASLKMVYDEHP